MITPLVIFIFGLLIGSFLNVCIYRIPRRSPGELSVIKPARSFCPSCKHQLEWWENIPVASWLALARKCRYCKEPISWQYPLVEFLSGVAAVASCYWFGLTLTGLLIYALTATLIVISFIDFEFKIIPNVISLPGIVIGLVLGVISEFTSWMSPPLTQGTIDSLVGMLIGGGSLYVIGELYYYTAKREGLGGGDIKLLGMTGAILGWQSLFTTIIVGSMLGAIVGVIWMMIKRGGRQMEIPFGPWLSLGAIFYIFSIPMPFVPMHFP